MHLRLFTVTALLLSLVGCYDFQGDAGRLGFSSNLKGDGWLAWTPDMPIAAGSTVHVVAAELINPPPGTKTDELPAVHGRVDGPVTLGRGEVDQEVVFTGMGRGAVTVTYTGVVDDSFSARFAPVAGATLSAEPSLADRHLAKAAFALAPGSTTALFPSLTDRRGRVLGYDPDALTVVADGPISAWIDQGMVDLSADGADGQSGHLALRYAGRTVWEDDVAIVDPSAVTELSLAELHLLKRAGEEANEAAADEGKAAIAIAWVDDTRLLGAPIQFTWDGDAEVDKDFPQVISVDAGHKATVHAALGDQTATFNLD
jgi:hypothetical protein